MTKKKRKITSHAMAPKFILQTVWLCVKAEECETQAAVAYWLHCTTCCHLFLFVAWTWMALYSL